MELSPAKISPPLTDDIVLALKAGDKVLLNGNLYAARDASHKRMMEDLDSGKGLPFDPMGQILYYVGPTPPRPGHVIGAAGPTTAYRMDGFTPRLLELGLKGTIGKGNRTEPVIDSMIKNRAVYFLAVGGTGAFLSKRIVRSEVLAYADLGPEAIYRLEVRDFPVIVAIDGRGNNLFRTTAGPVETSKTLK